MASLEIDKIQIQVSAQTKTAVTNLTKLKNGLEKLRDAVAECASMSSDGMDKLKELTTTIKTLASSGTGLKTVAEALKTIGRKSVTRFLKDMKEAQEETAKDFSGTVEKTSETVEGTVEGLKKGTEATKDFKKEWEKLKTSFADTRLGKSFGKISEFISSLKRIAMYRILRSAIKAVTQAISEGKEIYLEWSRSVNGEFAQVMDRLTVSFTLLKASIGSLVGEIVTLLEPALQWLMKATIDVTNAFTQMFAHLNGSDTWNKAYIKDAQAVVDANKKLKQSFLGIDEINTLGNNNGSSAAQSLLGIGYEETPVNKKTAITLEAILGTVTAIGLALKAWDIIKFVGQLQPIAGVGGVGGLGGIPLTGGGTVGGLLGTVLSAASAISGTLLLVFGFKAQMEEGVNIYNTIETLIGGALAGAGLSTILLGAATGPYGLAFGILFSLIGTAVVALSTDENLRDKFLKELHDKLPGTGDPWGEYNDQFHHTDDDFGEHLNEHPEVRAKYDPQFVKGLNEDPYAWAEFAKNDPLAGIPGGGTLNLYLDGQLLASTMSSYQNKAQTQLGVYQ